MNLRQWIVDKPIVAVAIMIVALGAVGYQLASNRKHPPVAHLERWYMDLRTGEFVTFATTDPQSPITLPNGHEGVIAHFFSCSDCSHESNRFLGYVQKVNIPPTTASNGTADEFGNRPKDWYSVDGKQWYVMFSAEANAITAAPAKRCGEATLQFCEP
jgi:hypothetical protein